MKKGQMFTKLPQKERALRVRSNLPVMIDGKRGITQDISVSGVLFEIEDHHQPGAEIEFSVELQTPGGLLNLVCKGEVVRSESVDGKLRIAAKIIEQEIKNAS